MQSSDRIRIVIVDDIPETRDNLRKLLQFEADIEVVGQASTGEEGVALAKKIHPHVVLMDINMPGLDGISASETITREMPATQVIMMSVQSESDYIRRSMLAGARDFLTKPFSGDELISTIRRVYERGRHAMPRVAAVQPGIPSVAPIAPDSRGKVITLFSPKGGAGCSVLAANLAVVLAQTDKKTVLVDANLLFGDMGVLLDIRGTHSIVDLAQRFEELDADLVSSVLSAHGSGLKVLLAPPRPEMGELVTATQLKEILAVLRARFDYIVVDTFTSLQDVMLTVLDQADRIILIATPDIPCIKDMRLFFEVVDQLKYERDKTTLILNRVDKHAGIGAENVANILKHPVSVSIPADERTVMFSVNQGVPFVIREPNKAITAAINELARLLRSALEEDEGTELEPTTATVRRSRLSRLFGAR